MATKEELRVRLKQARLGLTDAEHTVKSRQVVEQLQQAADWSQVKTLHYFEPLGELLEPDISGFITYIEDSFPGIRLFTPRQIAGSWQLVAVKGGAAPKSFDAVIVPMLGFDPESLQRLGYGGGYYDKFLVTQPAARKIGVAFEQGKTAGLPVESHDVPLDLIITESAQYA